MIDVLFLLSILSDWQWETWRSLAHDWVLLEAAESVLMYKRHHHFVFFSLLLPVPLSSWGRQNHQGGTWWKVSNMRAAVQVVETLPYVLQTRNGQYFPMRIGAYWSILAIFVNICAKICISRICMDIPSANSITDPCKIWDFRLNGASNSVYAIFLICCQLWLCRRLRRSGAVSQVFARHRAQ